MNTSNSLKKITTGIAISAALASPVSQAEVATETKQGLSFVGATLAGAAAGGPVGMMIGAISGAFIGETIEKADTAEETAMSLSQAQAELYDLRQQLANSQVQMEQLEQLAWHNLEFQLLFRTGSDELSDNGHRRLARLAEFLQSNPQLHIRLDGYADPRGTDEYNNVLSLYRAKNVRLTLEQMGVESNRIEAFSHGSKYAQSQDPKQFAQERRVSIELFKVEGDSERTASR